MPDQKPLNPEDKFKAMKSKISGGASMTAPATPTVVMTEEPKASSKKSSKPLVTKSSKKSKKDDETPFYDGKEALISEGYTEILKVDIRNRKEQFFMGDAKTVSSFNDTGEFDILPRHANFVTLIRGYVIIDKGLPSEKKFEVDNGVLAAKTGEVDVYLDF